jgi:GNAT superfamily N-acetyltransferase
MVNIRQANTCESGILMDIAARSEAYWGYDENFMDNYRTIYRVTEEFIIKNTTFVIEENDSIIGFYSIIKDERETTLEYFYIEPEKIGKGYGKVLWKHVTEYCKCHDIIEISLVTSPQAKDFYIKMGARLIGEVDSLVVKNRKIPKLIYTI